MWKIIKHGEKGLGDVTMEGLERFVRFAFDNYAPPNDKAFAELFDSDGNVVKRKPPLIDLRPQGRDNG